MGLWGYIRDLPNVREDLQKIYLGIRKLNIIILFFSVEQSVQEVRCGQEERRAGKSEDKVQYISRRFESVTQDDLICFLSFIVNFWYHESYIICGDKLPHVNTRNRNGAYSLQLAILL